MTTNKAQEAINTANNTPITEDTAELIDVVLALAKAWLEQNNKLSRLQYPDTTGQ